MDYPVLIYDDLCSSCTIFAKFVNKLLNGKITMIGHYSQIGKEFKKEIFPEGYDGLEMSWFVTSTFAYGGNQGLRKLIRYMMSGGRFKKDKKFAKNEFDFTQCSSDCKSVKGVLFRSCSILRESRVIPIKMADSKEIKKSTDRPLGGK